MRSVLYLTVDREREAGDRVTWLHPAVAVQPVPALLADTKHKLILIPLLALLLPQYIYIPCINYTTAAVAVLQIFRIKNKINCTF